MKPIKKSDEHLQKLKKIKRDMELGIVEGHPKFPKAVVDKIKDNFDTRKQLVEKYKKDKKDKVPGAKLGDADRGKVKEKDDKVKDDNTKKTKK